MYLRNKRGNFTLVGTSHKGQRSKVVVHKHKHKHTHKPQARAQDLKLCSSEALKLTNTISAPYRREQNGVVQVLCVCFRSSTVVVCAFWMCVFEGAFVCEWTADYQVDSEWVEELETEDGG